MSRALISAASLVLVSACAAPAAIEPEPSGQAWRCDAGAARSLIGSRRGAVMFPADANIRFVCTECAMTRDYRPDRLTIFYDEASGMIEDVRCV